MRSERVQTHLRCNQACSYCEARRSADEPDFVRESAVRARIAAAIVGGAREIVLTGGEPAMRRDLPALVRGARQEGAARVVLETNATLIDGALAASLRQAGLDLVLVNLAGSGAWLDALTRDAGGFAATLRGIEALIGAGISMQVQAAVVRSTHERLPELPALIRERFGEGVRALRLTVPVRSPDPGELLDYDTAGAAIRACEGRARRNGLALKLAPGSGPPPCVHGRDLRVAHLYSLTPGAGPRADHVQLPACERCGVRDRCPGIAREVIERFGAPAMTPITTDRARRRLSLISTVDEQVARELVTPNRRRDPTRGDLDEDVIRVVFQCNQACRFCFVSTHLPAAPEEAIERAIRSAAAEGKVITLSGGEPTLHPGLIEHVRLARSLSRRPVVLQTNATRIDAEYALQLEAAGLDEVFVSLHGASAAISDEITKAPGTFDKTVRGLDALAATSIRLEINFVICQANLGELPAWVALLASRWPRAHGIVSFVAPSTDVVPREHALVPRYSEVLPVLGEAVALAAELGVDLGGFESMCGVPLCLVPRALGPYFELSEIPPGFDAGEFVKTAACARCDLASRCYGLRRGYLELHGDGELSPVQSR